MKKLVKPDRLVDGAWYIVTNGRWKELLLYSSHYSCFYKQGVDDEDMGPGNTWSTDEVCWVKVPDLRKMEKLIRESK